MKEGRLASVLIELLTPTGLTLLHTALESPENLNMVKFLLSQEETLPLLLSSHDSSLPLDCAKKLVVIAT